MAKSALLKSSIVKKYWMALTGLFLCLFLAGHLAGNLQLIFGTAKQFNEYALFMTTNPAVKLLSYLTYISILFHAIDGIALTIQNKKARPVAYAKTDGSSSSFASRNMAVLGTIILVFIATHMVNFWAKMHFDKNMPLVGKEADNGMGMKQFQLLGTKDSPMQALPLNGTDKTITPKFMADVKAQTSGKYDLELKDGTTLINKVDGEILFIGYKDLHKLTVDFFKSKNKFLGLMPNEGLHFTIIYVLAMLALAFHLWHGFQSAFQSLGINNKFTPAIRFFGQAFAIVVPLLFAIIPIFLHFKK
jgi:succinate dehydrogenase / fumarate reductase cytochrome b subunit